MRPTLVIGVGNAARGDDRAGLEVARRLRARGLPGTVVKESSGDVAGLLEDWSGHDRVVMIDAASGGGPPGTVHRFEAHESPVPASLRCDSTHSLGISQAVEMARALGRLPPRLTIYAIEGVSFGHGGRLSRAVRRAVGEVEGLLLRDLGACA